MVQMAWERFGRADVYLFADQPIGAGCPGTLLAGLPPVCLSSDPTSHADTSQYKRVQSHSVAGGSLLAPGEYGFLLSSGFSTECLGLSH